MSTAPNSDDHVDPHRNDRSPDLRLLPRSSAHYSPDAATRPRVHGKFLFVGDEKLYVRGVTYGPFCSEDNGNGYGDPERVQRDLAQIAAHGLNAIRTYTVPPSWLLDAAWERGLHVMVGVPWEQHVAFLDSAEVMAKIEDRVRTGVRACARHPAILCYAIGNEIPASIVRWHDRGPVERFLERLYAVAKAEDPGALVTYVNYPSTEYLRLPFLDFVCFNVYLEHQDRLQAYLARLQNIAGSRPLLMAEIGLDSRGHGEERQAEVLDWQVRTAFGAGCAGTFVFAWTDEWYRGGQRIEDWAFGLTTAEREPKPALLRVQKAFAEAPMPHDLTSPRISVAVCSYNGAHTIDWCLQGIKQLDYPNFEVIVVDDGSADGTGDIALRHGVQVLRTPNRGLSHARNLALEAATGEIVAYIDDDASPDPHWLAYLATAFSNSGHAGVGGPNLPPLGDGLIAHCVANAPGGPVHVLLSDEEAEHIPGCNMAFRRSALQSIGGFDTQFRVAGDDVDICWRLQEQGWTLGFSPAAVVWHRRRPSIKAYWKQQIGYGKAEALLERKWPEKYNAAGHLTWTGRMYGSGLTAALRMRVGRIYRGPWGDAPFQSVYEPARGMLSSLPLMPEWYLIILLLAVLSGLGNIWDPLLLAVPAFVLALCAPILQAAISARRTSSPRSLHTWALTALLHVMQPMARLSGRLRHGLTPWRWRGGPTPALPWPHVSTAWSESWRSAEAFMQPIEAALREKGSTVLRGGDYDRWDLEVRGGLLGCVRMLIAVEEHGGGKQLARFRSWPRPSPVPIFLTVLLGALAIAGGIDHAWVAFASLAALDTFLITRILQECSLAMGAVLYVLETPKRHKVENVSPVARELV